MNRTLIACSLMSLLLSGAAVAQPNFDRDRDSDRDRREESRDDRRDDGRDYRDDRRDDARDYRDDRRDDRRDARNDRRDNDRGRGGPRWAKGDRVPGEFRRSQYFVQDWRTRGLKVPPRGYRWIRNDRNDFFLISDNTGIIIDVYGFDNRQDQWRRRYARTYTVNDDPFYRECQQPQANPAAAIVGALVGGLLGNQVGSGSGNTVATIAGIVAGGAAGVALTGGMGCEDRTYAYQTYSRGFNAGRSNASYQWDNPRNRNHGEFQVGRYYNDPDGFRCATYTQTIFIDGRPRPASGHACQQPDNSWAIID